MLALAPKNDASVPSGSKASVTLAPAEKPLRVFVVDDNADAADMLAMLIDGLGHQTSVETHPRRALERITHERPDVCLLDVGMPDIDGHALARAIRDAIAEAPILVAITATANRRIAPRHWRRASPSISQSR
jgi:CheY-like chemotaxis protein